MTGQAKDKVHFPNLDGLRFLGSLFLIVLHIEGLKMRDSREVIGFIYGFNKLGGLAVSLFFVLSGFLITYLLIDEKEKTSTINLRKFYFRRILKIWPLYFLIGIIGFLLLPKLAYFHGIYSINTGMHFGISFLLYCLFIPPFSGSLSTGQTWSVRVEEAFYFIWPLLLRRSKNYLTVFIAVVVFVVVLRNVSSYFVMNYNQHVFIILFNLFESYRISCMAIGGIGAYLYLKGNQKILSIIYRKDLQWLVYITTAILLVFQIHIGFILYEAYSALFSFIILNLATNPKSIVNLDYKWMNYLGKISYGLYMYNAIMRIFCFEFVEYVFNKQISGWQMNLVLYFTTIGSTILISILSYEYFEKPFLRIKKRFTVIKTEA